MVVRKRRAPAVTEGRKGLTKRIVGSGGENHDKGSGPVPEAIGMGLRPPGGRSNHKTRTPTDMKEGGTQDNGMP